MAIINQEMIDMYPSDTDSGDDDEGSVEQIEWSVLWNKNVK